MWACSKVPCLELTILRLLARCYGVEIASWYDRWLVLDPAPWATHISQHEDIHDIMREEP